MLPPKAGLYALVFEDSHCPGTIKRFQLYAGMTGNLQQRKAKHSCKIVHKLDKEDNKYNTEQALCVY